MLTQVRNAAICRICKCSLDLHAPYALIKQEPTHLDCADEYDSRDQGGHDLPPFVDDWSEETDFDEE